MSRSSTIKQRVRRENRVRSRIRGTATRPRLSVFRSNRALSAQIIDDGRGVTLLSAREKDVSGETPLIRAKVLGKEIAKRAEKKHITKVVFDRGRFLFAGRVKALADGARENGLLF